MNNFKVYLLQLLCMIVYWMLCIGLSLTSFIFPCHARDWLVFPVLQDKHASPSYIFSMPILTLNKVSMNLIRCFMQAFHVFFDSPCFLFHGSLKFGPLCRTWAEPDRMNLRFCLQIYSCPYAYNTHIVPKIVMFSKYIYRN